MILSRLELFNFRNYGRLDVELPPGVNLVIGRNAQGKTNLLEAIYFLSHLRSKRAQRMREVVLEGEESASARAVIVDEGRRITLNVGLGAAGRTVELNGRRVEQAARATGVMKCVMFEPGDLYLVKGEPSMRREFLDETMEELGYAGAHTVVQYRHLLRQRNAVLKRWEEYGRDFTRVLEPWSEKLAEYGGSIISERLKTVGMMSAFVEDIYREVSGSSRNITFRYQCTVETGAKTQEEAALAMREALEKSLAEDKRSRKTTIGPHRDEVEIKIDGREARYQASQGEQRTLAFAMRFAQKEQARKISGKEPVLLLDDVLSELDEKRRGKVLEMAGNCEQSVITATEIPAEAREAAGGSFVVEGGKITVG